MTDKFTISGFDAAKFASQKNIEDTPKPKRKRNSIEAKHQKALISWARLQKLPECETIKKGACVVDYLFSIPNEREGDAKKQKKFNDMGRKAGVSDLMLALPWGNYSGLWIELKSPKSYDPTVTASQQEWIDKMNIAGYYACVCYGWEEAQKTIELYLAHGL